MARGDSSFRSDDTNFVRGRNNRTLPAKDFVKDLDILKSPQVFSAVFPFDEAIYSRILKRVRHSLEATLHGWGVAYIHTL